MTVIAWDGKSIAADRMSECESLIRTSIKIVRAKNHSDTMPLPGWRSMPLRNLLRNPRQYSRHGELLGEKANG